MGFCRKASLELLADLFGSIDQRDVMSETDKSINQYRQPWYSLNFGGRWWWTFIDFYPSRSTSSVCWTPPLRQFLGCVSWICIIWKLQTGIAVHLHLLVFSRRRLNLLMSIVLYLKDLICYLKRLKYLWEQD